MEQHIGFIGLGNMGTAILEGVLAQKMIAAQQIHIFDIHSDKLAQLHQKHGVVISESNKQLAKDVDILFLAVKPNNIAELLAEIQKDIKKETLIISIAAGITIKSIEALIGYEHKIIRVMPNTPILVGEGMSSITANAEVSPEELAIIKTLFDGVGLSEVVPESLIHAVVGVSGSSPAYVFMFIEAMADAAVLAGMPRQQAYKFAAQSVLGAAKMVLETGKHPGELKDMVCSPAGTTIEAVKKLEEKGFRSAVIEAIDCCVHKSELMSKQ